MLIKSIIFVILWGKIQLGECLGFGIIHFDKVLLVHIFFSQLISRMMQNRSYQYKCVKLENENILLSQEVRLATQ